MPKIVTASFLIGTLVAIGFVSMPSAEAANGTTANTLSNSVGVNAPADQIARKRGKKKGGRPGRPPGPPPRR